MNIYGGKPIGGDRHGLWDVPDKVSLGAKPMANNFLNPAFKRQPLVTGQYEQMPQGTGGGTGANPYGAFQPAKAPPAPWMNAANPITMGAYNQPTFASTAPAQSSAAQVDAARLNRQEASRGRLNYTPGGNVGNYQFSPGDTGGINVQNLLAQNPAAFHGFSDASKAKITQGGINPLAGIQQAYQQRQAAAGQNMLARQQMVQQNAMAKNQARQGRLDARNQGPNIMDQLMQQDPETALAAMQMQNQNMLAQQHLGIEQQKANNMLQLGQGENAWRQKNADAQLAANQGDQALKKQEVAANLLGAAAAIRTTNPELADQMEQHAMAQMGGQNVMAGMAGAPQGQRKTNPVQEEALATKKTAREKRDYMRDVMKLSQQEITQRLQQDYQPSLANSAFGAVFGSQRGAPNAAMPEGPMIQSPYHNSPGVMGALTKWFFPPPAVGLPPSGMGPYGPRQQRGFKYAD